jgi:hypothetical protein
MCTAMTDALIDRPAGLDYLSMRKQVVAAINRNDLAWLFSALGIPIGASRSELVAVIQEMLRKGDHSAWEVLRESSLSGVPSSPEVALLLFEFGPATIMMISSDEPRYVLG